MEFIKIKKTITSLFLAATMLIGMLPGTALAADTNDKADQNEPKQTLIYDIIYRNKDFQSERLLVRAEDEKSLLNDDGILLGNIDDMYLVQYDSEKDAMNAYTKYKFKRADAFIDQTVQLAADKDVNDKPEEITMSEGDNPFAYAESMIGNSEKADIALIDTGVRDESIDRYSVIGDLSGTNKHGDDMLFYIKAEDQDAKVSSIRALNDDGIGTVSDVYAAIKLAMDMDVDFINLSIYAKSTKDNECIVDLIKEAEEQGITVVGAAGNENDDASFYIPGKINEATIVGSSTLAGERRQFSNYGDTVDYYIPSESTSEAAARMTGRLSKGDDIDKLLKSGDLYQDVKQVNKELETEHQKDILNENVIPNNLYRPMTDLYDGKWRDLSDEKLNEYYWNNGDDSIYGLYMNMSDSEMNEFLKRDTLFAGDREWSDENGDHVEKDYEFVIRVNEESIKNQSSTSDFKTAGNVTSSLTAGVYYIKFTRPGSADVTYKMSVTLKSASVASAQTPTISKSEYNSTAGTCGEATFKQTPIATGKAVGSSNYYIIRATTTFTQPAYCRVASVTKTVAMDYACGFIHSSTNNGNNTLTTGGNYRTGNTTRTGTFHINMTLANFTVDSDGQFDRSYCNINFGCQSLYIYYGMNGGTCDYDAHIGTGVGAFQNWSVGGTRRGYYTQKYYYQAVTLGDANALFKRAGYHIDPTKAYNRESTWYQGQSPYTARTGTFAQWNATGVNTSYASNTLSPATDNKDYAYYGVILQANWIPNTVTVAYNANGGTISDSPHYAGSINSWFRLNGSTVQRSTTSATSGFANIAYIYSYNNNIDLYDTTTFNLTRTGYHIDLSKMWKSTSGDTNSTSTKYYDHNTVAWTSMGNAASTNTNVTVYANWIPNILTINYYANGAARAESTGQAKLGELSDDYKNNTTPIGVSTGNYGEKGIYFDNAKSPGLTNKNVNIETLGLPNANPTGSIWDLTRPGYVATEYWHIGNPNGPLISADTTYSTMQALAADLGVNLGAGNQTVNLYADWEPLPSTLFVNYVDEDGNEIMQSDTLEGVTDKEYETRPAVIDGYTLVGLPDNISGKMKANQTDVNYVYRRTTYADIPKIEKETQVTREVQLYDDSEKIQIKITKTDQTGNSKLEGAVFQVKALTDIYDKDGDLLFEKDGIITYGTTNAAGELDFGTMFPTNKFADQTQYRAAGNNMYEVTEVSAPEGCVKSDQVIKINAKPSTSAAIAEFNYNVQNTVNDYITVKKRWVDGSTANRKTVYVDVYNGSTLVKSNVKLDSDNEWTVELKDVPRTNNGTAISYRFVEKTINSGTEQSVPAGYKYSGQKYNAVTGVGTITNVSTSRTSADVKKDWKDNNNEDNIRPESVEVDLMQINVDDDTDYVIYDRNYETKTLPNGVDVEDEIGMFWEVVSSDEDAGTTTYKVFKPYVLSEENGWHVSVSNLPQTRSDGTPVIYKFEERTTDLINGDARSGYAVSYKQSVSETETQMQTTEITNKHDEIPTKAKVIKVWDDFGQNATTPNSIQVNLLANGEPYEDSNTHNPLTVRKSNGWILEVNNLPRFVNGEEAHYTFEEIISEDGIAGKLPNGTEGRWSLGDVSTNGNTTQITNTFSYVFAYGKQITVNKVWNDNLTDSDASARKKPVFVLRGYDEDGNIAIEKSSASDTSGENWTIINDRIWRYTFDELSKDLRYVITENPYEGYVTTTENGEGNTYELSGGEEEATFINTEKEKQNFSVEKIVTGDTGEQTRKFDFTTKLTGLEKNKTYQVMYTPWYEDGTRYSFNIPGIINDATPFKIAFDLYLDESTGRVEGDEITSVQELKDIDTNVYDEAFEIYTIGETTWRRSINTQKVYTEIDLYHKTGTDETDARNWVVDVWSDDDLIVEKVPLIAGDVVTTENLATLRERNIRYSTFKSDKNGNATVTFQLQHGEKFTIKEIPVGSTAKVDENIEGLTYTNKFEYYDDNTPAAEYDNDTEGTINITEDTLNPTVRCTNISNLKRDFHLRKIVTGNVGSRDRGFAFRINLEKVAKHTNYDVIVRRNNDVEQTYTVTSTMSGDLSLRVKLAHGEEVIVKEIPSKAVCTTYEETGLIEKYTATWDYQYVDRDEIDQQLSQDDFSEENYVTIDKEAEHGAVSEAEITCTINTEQEDPTLICTNNAETTVPTGLLGGRWKPMVAVIIIAGAAIAILLRKKKYQENN